jgi:transcriptional regulator with XRE-family HTH domain
MKLAQYIKNARIYKGMTQKDTAVKLGTSVVFVSLMESGESKIPLDKLKKLIKIYSLHKSEVVKLAVDQYEKMLLQELL